MSALRMLAWGMVKLHEMTPDQRKLLQRDAKFEAHAHGYWISGCKQLGCCAQERLAYPMGYSAIEPEHKLTRWNKKAFRNPRRPSLADRNKPIVTGSFAECCKELVGMIGPITPSNPAE